jgi:hypothetical protein
MSRIPTGNDSDAVQKSLRMLKKVRRLFIYWMKGSYRDSRAPAEGTWRRTKRRRIMTLYIQLKTNRREVVK